MGGETVSVVVTTHYRNERLRAALESVFEQSYRPLEVLVVDDAEGRHARPVVAAFDDVDYVHQDDADGQRPAHNRGIELTSGEYVQLLDDDDQLLPGKLRQQVELLAERDEVGVVHCGMRTESREVRRPNPEARGDVLELALRQGPMFPCLTSTMLFERSALEPLLPLPDMPGATDVDLRIRLAKRTAFDYVDAPLVLRGEPDEHVGESLENIRGNVRTLEMHAALYDERPVLRDEIRAHLYRRLARHHLDGRRWSARAIGAYLRAARTTPDGTLIDVARAASLLGGTPVLGVAQRLYAAGRGRLG